MTDLQLELTRLIGSKELSIGCEIIVHDENFIMHRSDRKATINHVNEHGDLLILYFVDCISGFDKHSSKVPINGYIHHDDADTYGSIEIIGHPATLSDLHRWFIDHEYYFDHYDDSIRIRCDWRDEIKNFTCGKTMEYDSSLDLLGQSESTLQAIINLIKEYEEDNMEAN